MKTCEIFKNKTSLSFEVFPPRSDTPIDSIYSTVDELAHLKPDFISVTYGAGGNGSNATIGICEMIKEKHSIEPVAHLACINLTREKVLFELAQMKAAGIENILALRGDVNPNIPPHDDFKYASELIELIKENGDFNVIGACYPETHPEAASGVEDIKHLKEKVDAGCSQLISQLFFDNEDFYAFREKAAIAGIDVPIEAGIMPVTNPKTIARMATLCHARLPKKFLTIMQKYENDPIAMRDAGIAYAVSQIVDLIANDVDGIHLYTMNNPYIASKICEAVQTLFR
ncbi:MULTISPECIES: methylenetetrahydrofolate reductase [NAD(P)H] [Ruminococcus]|uniref:Methylenetetrahydrofolate reductase n=1 Tax=Ruminococcus albus (strain ATCC 27210 / DSM 20455 / JCM 14654 / NCDO 2250 / 7) TaxID=697329 RepID=E6UHW0_RUMA7|nr:MULTISPECIES: methylenetetrahydrofolate reductase [NAD(P)H] [Ruminococcus]ADU23247.1 5,10-methylenetetrahydrofolate reductase [Ruminococcus albus 7 = DSM 20455]MCR5021036.1 methylenetetrahydrofolate reductase [NAD(P)H] [Ruminococcus sp.]